MLKHLKRLTMLLLIHLAFASFAYAHCEIPCGIYDDQARVDLISEHIDTIEKSIRMIQELSAAEKVNYNQLVRWVTNKDDHAEKIQHVIAEYFLTQRIKPAAEDEGASYKKYILELTALHRLVVLSMKTEQATDLGLIEQMRSQLKLFSESYFSSK